MLALMCGPARADLVDLRELVGHKWIGTGLTNESLRRASSERLEIAIAADNTISGKATSSVTIKNVRYTSTSVVTGKLIASANKLDLKYGETRGDRLPDSMSWCNNFVRLTFFEDKAKPKHHLLEGEAIGIGPGCPDVTLEYAD